MAEDRELLSERVSVRLPEYQFKWLMKEARRGVRHGKPSPARLIREAIDDLMVKRGVLALDASGEIRFLK